MQTLAHTPWPVILWKRYGTHIRGCLFFSLCGFQASFCVNPFRQPSPYRTCGIANPTMWSSTIGKSDTIVPDTLWNIATFVATRAEHPRQSRHRWACSFARYRGRWCFDFVRLFFLLVKRPFVSFLYIKRRRETEEMEIIYQQSFCRRKSQTKKKETKCDTNMLSK